MTRLGGRLRKRSARFGVRGRSATRCRAHDRTARGAGIGARVHAPGRSAAMIAASSSPYKPRSRVMRVRASSSAAACSACSASHGSGWRWSSSRGHRGAGADAEHGPNLLGVDQLVDDASLLMHVHGVPPAGPLSLRSKWRMDPVRNRAPCTTRPCHVRREDGSVLVCLSAICPLAMLYCARSRNTTNLVQRRSWTSTDMALLARISSRIWGVGTTRRRSQASPTATSFRIVDHCKRRNSAAARRQ